MADEAGPGRREQLLRELVSLDEEENRRIMVRSEPLLREREAIDHLHAEVVRLAYADLEQAGRYEQAARSIAAETGDAYGEAMSLRCSGHVHYRRAYYQDAASSYQGALEGLEALGLETEAARTRLGGMQALIYLGQYDQALQWAARARDVFERHGDRLRLARLESNLGNLFYRQDRYDEALAAYRRAYADLREIGQPPDIAAALSNMAVCCTSMNDFAQAIECYRQTREFCGINRLGSLVAEADYNIAYLHYLRGEYRQAIDLYDATRIYCRESGDAYHSALCDLDEAEMYLELNLSDQGARLAAEAATAFERLGMKYEQAKALVSLAIAASDLRDISRAVRLFRQARRLFVEEGNQLWPATIDIYQATLFHMRGKNSEARRFCARALRKLPPSAAGGRAALCHLLKAQILRESGDLATAHEIVCDTLNMLRRFGIRSLQFHANFLLGQIEEESGKADAAYVSYQAAREEIETLRVRLWGEEPQVAFLRDKLSLYENMVGLRLGISGPGSIEEAFQLIEEAKSRRLADSISIPRRLRKPHEADRDVAATVEDLRRRLQGMYRQIERVSCLPDASRQLENLRRQARDCESRLLGSITDLRAIDQESAVLLGAGPVPLEAIRAAIPEGAMLLEYYQVREVIHVCLLGKKELRIEPLGPAAHTRDTLRQLRFQMAKVRLGPDYLRRFADTWRKATESHLRSLHAVLIAPIRQYIKAGHLIIAPHGRLHDLPFHALLGEGKYLIDEFTVSYAPSGSVYALCAARARSKHEGSLVLGIPDANTPFIEDEARGVAEIIPKSRLFLGAAATGEALGRYAPDSRIIHLATHGTFRTDNPMFSSIQLGDGPLNLTDLYQVPLGAELVTLSGCSTGLNAVVGGDELIGLMRGFLSAGARSLLVSLWEVNDRGTAEFMASFYRSLMDQGDKGVAVRQAMRDVRERYPHPYYWAPFILVGSYRK